jgi:c-di-GMP-binding flagellar brake protein YcgR
MVTIKSEVSIPVGEPCQIQMEHGKHPSFFRGYSYPKYILLDGPVSRGVPVVAFSGTLYVVRFINEGLVYGYESMLMKQYTSPVNLWVMRYPDEIQAVNLRKSQRMSTFIPASFASGEGAITGAIVDISEGGGFFVAPGHAAIQPGQMARMDMTLPNGEKIIGFECKICSVKPNGSKVSFGINFNQLDTVNSQKIKAFYLLLVTGA